MQNAGSTLPQLGKSSKIYPLSVLMVWFVIRWYILSSNNGEDVELAIITDPCTRQSLVETLENRQATEFKHAV